SESWSLRSMMVPCLFGIANQRHKRALPVCLERPPESRGKPAFAPSLEQQSILDSDKSKQFSKIKVQSGLFDFRMTVTPETANVAESRQMSKTNKAIPLIVDEETVRHALPHLNVRVALTEMFRGLANDAA